MQQPPISVPQASVVKTQRDVPGDVTATSQSRIFKVIVIGDSNVGKTCLTFRFCGGRFPERVETTIGVDFREKSVMVSGEEIKLQIWDTAGQERFRRSMVAHYYRNVHAVVFVYDVSKMATFENLPNWISECNHNCVDQSALRVLVGNKNDLGESNKVVSSTMARKFAEFHEMQFYETSAKDETETVYINDIFVNIAQRLHSMKAGTWWPHGAVNSSRATAGAETLNLRPTVEVLDETYCSC